MIARPDHRVLFISCDFPPQMGGESRFAASLLGAIRKPNWWALVPANSTRQSLPKTASVRLIKRWLPLGISEAAKVFRTVFVALHAGRIARSKQLNVVIAFQPIAAGFAALVVHKAYGNKYLVFVHGGDLLEYGNKPFSRSLLRTVLRNADIVVANSSYTKQLVGIVSQKSLKKTALLHPPFVSPRPQKEMPMASGFRSLREACKGAFVLLTTGRLIAGKGHSRVIEGMLELRRRSLEYRYVIVGDGPERATLEAQRDTYGLGDCVFFAGRLSDADLVRAYEMASLFVLMSEGGIGTAWVEGFGIVLLEAAYFGLPIVATRTGGIVDAVEEGKNALLVPQGDVGGMVEAVEQLRLSPDRMSTFAAHGKQRVLQHFSAEVAGKKLVALVDTAHDRSLA